MAHWEELEPMVKLDFWDGGEGRVVSCDEGSRSGLCDDVSWS